MAGIGGIGGIEAVGGGGLGALAQLYREQVAGAGSTTGSPGAPDGVGGIGGVGGTSPSAAARGADFGAMVGDGLRSVEALDRSASQQAVKAATGDLREIHDYTIAASKAQSATELTATVRNRALEAFGEIMRMPL